MFPIFTTTRHYHSAILARMTHTSPYRFIITRFKGDPSWLFELEAKARKKQDELDILMQFEHDPATGEWIVWYDFESEAHAALFKLTWL